MGWFDRLRKTVAGKPTPPRRKRGPAADPNIVEKRIVNRALLRLEKANPERADDLVLKRAGYITEPAPEKENEFDQFLNTRRKLKAAGLLPPGEPETSSGLPEWLVPVLSGIGQTAGTVVAALGQNLANSRAIEGQSTVVSVEEPTRSPAWPQIEEAPAAAIAEAVYVEPVAQSPTPETGAPMFDISAAAINQLNGKTPAEAASLLAKIHHPDALALVGDLCETPDRDLPVLLFQLTQTKPQFQGLVEWLRQRPDWLIQTVWELRQISGFSPREAELPAERSAI